MSTTDETHEETTRNPFTRWPFVLGALFLGLVVVAGTVLAFLTIPDDATTADGPACERPASTDTTVSGALPVDGWVLRGAAATPDTPFGPDRVRDGAPVCYEHSPAGAAVAAVHVVTLGSNGSTTTALEGLGVEGDATDAALAQTPDPEPVPEEPVPPVAFRVSDYTGDAATVVVVMDTAGGTRAVTVDLLWDGDWKWDVPTESLDVTAVYSLNGYNRIPTPQEEARG